MSALHDDHRAGGEIRAMPGRQPLIDGARQKHRRPACKRLNLSISATSVTGQPEFQRAKITQPRGAGAERTNLPENQGFRQGMIEDRSG
jgi:hypothetical protein